MYRQKQYDVCSSMSRSACHQSRSTFDGAKLQCDYATEKRKKMRLFNRIHTHLKTLAYWRKKI